MNDDLDRIMSNEQEIIPSPAFVGSVMGAVRCEACAPPPLSFPWKRALPGLVAAVLALVAVVATGILSFIPGSAVRPSSAMLPSALDSIVKAGKATGAAWIALALVLSLVSVKVSVRFCESRVRSVRLPRATGN